MSYTAMDAPYREGAGSLKEIPERMTIRKGGAIALLLALLVGAGTPALLSAVVALGWNVPQDELVLDYLIAVVWAIVLGLAIAMAPVPPRDRSALLWIWLAKVFVALGFGLVYEAMYQELDAYDYFIAATASGYPLQFEVGNGTINTISLVRLHAWVFPDSFHAMKVSWALIGLLGVYLCYRACVLYLGRGDSRILLVLGLFPSILFWSSTLGKDPLALLGIALYLYGVVAWFLRRSPGYLWLLFGGILFAAAIRLWLAPILFAPLLVLAYTQIRGRFKRAALVLAGLGATLFLVRFFVHALGFTSLTDLISAASLAAKVMAKGGSGLDLAADLESPQAVLRFLPLGIFTALFRPLPGDVMNAFGLLAGVENAGLLLLLVLAVKRTRWAEVRSPLIAWAIALVLSWSLFYAFLSSFNLGAAVRFKLQILPVLLMLLLYLGRRRDDALQAAAVGTSASRN